MTTTLNVPDGTLTVDHSGGEVLLECDSKFSVSYWLTTDQALELAAALTGAVLEAMRSASPTEGT